MNHIDMGERQFSFRITTDGQIARQAQIYNEAPQLLSFFPSGDGEGKRSVVIVDNPEIILSSVKKRGDAYEMCLYNASDRQNNAELTCVLTGEKKLLHFEKCEIKTIEF